MKKLTSNLYFRKDGTVVKSGLEYKDIKDLDAAYRLMDKAFDLVEKAGRYYQKLEKQEKGWLKPFEKVHENLGDLVADLGIAKKDIK